MLREADTRLRCCFSLLIKAPFNSSDRLLYLSTIQAKQGLVIPLQPGFTVMWFLLCRRESGIISILFPAGWPEINIMCLHKRKNKKIKFYIQTPFSFQFRIIKFYSPHCQHTHIPHLDELAWERPVFFFFLYLSVSKVRIVSRGLRYCKCQAEKGRSSLKRWIQLVWEPTSAAGMSQRAHLKTHSGCEWWLISAANGAWTWASATKTKRATVMGTRLPRERLSAPIPARKCSITPWGLQLIFI